MKTHVWIEPPRDVDGRRRLSIVIEHPDSRRSTIWFSVPLEYSDRLSERADAFAVISLFTAMRLGSPTRVHGEVSPSLLRNLEEFQAVWSCWGRGAMVEMSADVERENGRPGDEERVILAFSGGVDAAFSAYRHRRRLAGRRTRAIGAGMMIQGYDVPAGEDSVFAATYARARRMTDDLGIDLMPVTTNYREVEPVWEEVHLACVAACLTLFEGCYGVGMVGGSDSYDKLSFPWASTPFSDPLLGGANFPILHDGADHNRVGKLGAMAGWEEAARSLVVCWEPTADGRNCCRCIKCIRTILSYRAMGLGPPVAFDRDVSDAQIAGMRGLSAIGDYEDILEAARANGVTGTWVRVLTRVVRNYRLRETLGRQDLVVKLRRTLNGNPVGRRLWALVGRK